MITNADEARAAVDEIRELAGDDERAHAREDSLRERVLEMIDEATDIAQNCQVSVDDPSSDELIAFETRYGAHPSFGPQRPVSPVVWKQLVGEVG